MGILGAHNVLGTDDRSSRENRGSRLFTGTTQRPVKSVAELGKFRGVGLMMPR